MTQRRLVALPVALLVAALGSVSLPQTASAQEGGAAAPPATAAPAGPDKKTVEAARTAYKKGEKAYAEKKWKEAFKHFKKAFDTLPSPHALYWMAMCLDQQGLKKEAYEAFVTFFSEARFDKVGDEKVGVARGRLNALGAEPGELVIRPEPADATVEVDGAAQAGPGPRKLTLPGGRHTVKVSAPGKQAQTLEISVAPFGATDQAVTLTAEEAPPPPPPAAEPPPPAAEPPPPAATAPPAATTAPEAPAEEKSNLPAYITLGVAGVGAIVGTVFGLQALSAQSDFDANPTTALADDAERNALIADVGFFTALTLGVTGVVLLTASDEPAEGAPPAAAARVRRPTLRVAPYVTPQGGGAAARWRF